MDYHRPDGFIGGTPAYLSPSRQPKKKIDSWIKNEGGTDSGKAVAAPPKQIALAAKEEVTETIVGEEEYIEEVVESDIEEEIIEEQEVSETTDDSSEDGEAADDFEKNIKLLAVQNDVRGFESDDDEFEALPPPIAIPNALRPKHLREAEPPVTSRDDDSDSTEDSSMPEIKQPVGIMPARVSAPTPAPTKRSSQANDSDDDSGDDSDDEHAVKAAAPAPVALAKVARSVDHSLRPDQLRGQSFIKKSEKKKEEKPVKRWTPPKPTPIPDYAKNSIDHDLRPKAVRGKSFTDDDPKDVTSSDKRIGGKKPAKSPAVVDNTPPQPTKEAIEKVAQSVDHSLRPATVRGKSFDNDSEVATAMRPGSKRGDTDPPAAAATGPATSNDDWQDQRDIGWTKPDWTKNAKLRSTGKADVMKTQGNLAAPITSLPHQKEDGPFAKPEWTGDASSAVGQRLQNDPAKPVTNIRDIADGSNNLQWQKPDWTQNLKLRGTQKGEKLKTGSDIVRPINGIKPLDA